MKLDLRNPSGIKTTGRLTKLILTAENVAEQKELAALAVMLGRGPIVQPVAPTPAEP